MEININNIFEVSEEKLPEELIEIIERNENIRIERIISEGQRSPENFWYNQDRNEFVILLKGSAKLMFENGETVNLKPGDYLIIPKHKKHRVEYTSEIQKTFWLAVHY